MRCPSLAAEPDRPHCFILHPALSHRGGVLRVFIDFLPALRRDENKKPPPASGAVLGYTLQRRFLSGHPVLSVAFGGLCGSMVSSFRKHATPTP